GMQTGRPLYVVGASTFGANGGYVMPGLLMGVLQIGWFAVATYFAAQYIAEGLHNHSRWLFVAITIVWGYALAWVAIKGIRYVARVAQFLNWVPLAMILIVFFATRHGIAHYHPAAHHPAAAFALILTMVIGFFATAGAAGADFGINSRGRKDVAWGGLIGITLAVLVAGGLPLLSVAGAIGSGATTSFVYTNTIATVGGLSALVFFLFAIASLVPTSFCAFIASNSFGTMLPGVPKALSTLIAVTVGVILAATGVVNNLIAFFTLVGASFGPICGAIAADYLLAGRKWSGPRQGINWVGYAAWAVGFFIGIMPSLHFMPAAWRAADSPAVLYSFIAGLIVYTVLAKLGARPALTEEVVFQAQA
ncbi:MAG: cytosine permease, partial [Terriglobales bacterium]